MVLDITADLTEIKILPASELEEIAQNVKMILATARGSCPMDREFGIDTALLDSPINTAQARLTAQVAAAIREQEPRARVNKVSFNGQLSDGQLRLTVQIQVEEKLLKGGV